MRAFFAKRLDGSFVAACETSETYVRKVSPGEAIEVDLKTRNTRSVRWHRRYWALCNMIYQNVERITIAGEVIEFNSVDKVHLTLKSLAGLVDGVIVLPDGTRAYLIRSIAFDAMTADEWADAWKKMLDVVHQYILPSVAIASIENEIARIAA
jgi:hypothetical protein